MADTAIAKLKPDEPGTSTQSAATRTVRVRADQGNGWGKKIACYNLHSVVRLFHEGYRVLLPNA